MCEEEDDKRNHAASAFNSSKKDSSRQKYYANYKVPDENVPSNMCHQCQRNKGRVVRCRNCTPEFFFDSRMKKEYPKIKDEKFFNCCYNCCDNCNCVSCPRNVRPEIHCDICNCLYSNFFCPHKVHRKVKEKIDFKPSEDEKVGYSIYILHVLYPFLKRLNEQQIKEKAIESKIQVGVLLLINHTDYQFDPEEFKLTYYDCPLKHTLKERLQLVGVDFINSLPFKEYTSPRDGYLNLATKLKFPRNSFKPEMGFKTYIAYAINQELGRGDSVTKLHCDKSDVVNVLVDIPKVTPNRNKRELGIDNTEKRTPDLSVDGSDLEDGGAMWDIFRREDTPKLEEYLKKHFEEFKDDIGRPLQQVVHPIHDHTFYLTMDHKRKLKEEFGIEPWTFVQKLGDAVLIPAGCAHQVKNLKSCIKVAINFVSPENICESIRLTEDFRLLPQNHKAKEDTLEVKKIALDALEAAVEDLEKFVPKNSRHPETSQDRLHLQNYENSQGFPNFNQVPITQKFKSWQNTEKGATGEVKSPVNLDKKRFCPKYVPVMKKVVAL